MNSFTTTLFQWALLYDFIGHFQILKQDQACVTRPSSHLWSIWSWGYGTTHNHDCPKLMIYWVTSLCWFDDCTALWASKEAILVHQFAHSLKNLAEWGNLIVVNLQGTKYKCDCSCRQLLLGFLLSTSRFFQDCANWCSEAMPLLYVCVWFQIGCISLWDHMVIICVCVCVVSNWLYQSVGSHLTVVYLPVQLFVLQGSWSTPFVNH